MLHDDLHDTQDAVYAKVEVRVLSESICSRVVTVVQIRVAGPLRQPDSRRYIEAQVENQTNRYEGRLQIAKCFQDGYKYRHTNFAFFLFFFFDKLPCLSGTSPVLT